MVIVFLCFAMYSHTINTINIKTAVFSDCISIIFKPLVDAVEDPPKVDCADGFTRTIVPLVAAWLGDREEHETITAVVKVSVFCSKMYFEISDA
jgi:hypothetical protein